MDIIVNLSIKNIKKRPDADKSQLINNSMSLDDFKLVGC